MVFCTQQAVQDRELARLIRVPSGKTANVQKGTSCESDRCRVAKNRKETFLSTWAGCMALCSTD
jgi:hypothetical protein